MMADNLTKAQRSYCMSRVRGSDTSIERRLRSELHMRGLRFRKNLKKLPGKPDIVFTRARVAVFIDGDFWHGYQFASWEETLSEPWKKKISENRVRDRRNVKALKALGWNVIRVWEHEVEKGIEQCVEKITTLVKSGSHQQSN